MTAKRAAGSLSEHVGGRHRRPLERRERDCVRSSVGRSLDTKFLAPCPVGAACRIRKRPGKTQHAHTSSVTGDPEISSRSIRAQPEINAKRCEMARPKNEHTLHASTRNPLKSKHNLHHPSSARWITAPPRWLRSGAFTGLLGAADGRSVPAVHTIRTRRMICHPAPRKDRQAPVIAQAQLRNSRIVVSRFRPKLRGFVAPSADSPTVRPLRSVGKGFDRSGKALRQS